VRSFEIGVIVPLNQSGPDRTTPRRPDIRAFALRAEAIGFDTVWTPDELLWRPKDRPVMGIWEGISMAAQSRPRRPASRSAPGSCRRSTGTPASSPRRLRRSMRSVAAAWSSASGRVMSGRVRPGHSAFPKTTSSRASRRCSRSSSRCYGVATPTSKASGTRPGTSPKVPVGPRPGRIPLMIGGNGPKGQRNAARYADIWSSWAEERSNLDEFGPRLTSLEAVCAEVGRDPATIGRSAGVDVSPLHAASENPNVIAGSPEEIAAALRALPEGVHAARDHDEPGSTEALEALAPALELLEAD
jgi:alkanesulfonate monooxygenase SsuD/methylene tetrahydromethanopterin reductase-like flavin-dependent oxidoreductase (luciferase family)